MDNVGFGKGEGDEIVDVGREASEAGLVAHEAMDVHEE